LTGEFPGEHSIGIKITDPTPNGNLLLRQFVRGKIDGRRQKLALCKYLAVQMNKVEGVDSLNLGVVTSNGITYRKQVPVSGGKQVLRIPLAQLSLGETMIQPEGYPSFLPDTFNSETNIPLNVQDIEFIEIMTGANTIKKGLDMQVMSVWLE
jgi:hypothetical protein